MTPAAIVETVTSRIQNIFHDVSLGSTSAPAPGSAPGGRVPAGPHNHPHGGAEDHAHE